MTRRPWWPVKCPVCGEELPETGNRRVYVTWKRGFRLVHADDCAGLIEAQGVLTFAQPKPEPLSPVLLVRARARVKALLERDELLKHSPEELTAIACLRVARFEKQLVRDESPEELDRLHQHALELVNRVLHAPEYSDPTGRLLA